MLSLLISLWITPCEWRCRNPSHVSRLTAAICASDIQCAVTTSVRLPPSMYSITTHRSPLNRYESLKLTIFGCDDSRITRISLMMRSCFGCFSRFICLIATGWPSLSCAVYTPPEALSNSQPPSSGRALTPDRSLKDRGTCRWDHRANI